jgi:glucosamine-6-phosphate deaminase
MRVIIREDQHSVAQYCADYLKLRLLQFAPTMERPFVLGMPAAHTPLFVLKKLVSYYKRGEISFQNVVIFIMDEYVDLPRPHPESHYSFMYHHLLRHVDVPREHVYCMDGNSPHLEQECRQFEERIHQFGGIELFLAGVAEDGDVAFNEPGSSLVSRTRLKTLAYETIVSRAKHFENDIAKVPKMALTMGINTLMDAREIMVIVCGPQRTMTLKNLIEKGVSHMCTVSMIQMHPKAIVICDEDATAECKVKTVRYFRSIQKVYRDLVEEIHPAGQNVPSFYEEHEEGLQQMLYS